MGFNLAIPILLLLCLSYMVNIVSAGSLFISPLSLSSLLTAMDKQPGHFESQVFSEFCALVAPIFGLNYEFTKLKDCCILLNYYG